MPRPDDPLHADLLRRVNQFLLVGAEFRLPPVEFTYHAMLSKESELAQFLRHDHSFSSLRLRTQKDMFAYHPDLRIAFEYDAKTNQSGPDFYVELIPFADGVIHSRFGSECLFCFEAIGSLDIGVWANDFSASLVDTIYLFDRWEPDSLAELYRLYGPLFPNAHVKRRPCRSGSGDPAVRILNATCRLHFEFWRAAICHRMDRGPSKGLVARPRPHPHDLSQQE